MQRLPVPARCFSLNSTCASNGILHTIPLSLLSAFTCGSPFHRRRSPCFLLPSMHRAFLRHLSRILPVPPPRSSACCARILPQRLGVFPRLAPVLRYVPETLCPPAPTSTHSSPACMAPCHHAISRHSCRFFPWFICTYSHLLEGSLHDQTRH
jgi:hypothetical protein